MCETYMLTYMDHILKALYSGIYDKRHMYGYIYVFFSYTFHIWLFRMGGEAVYHIWTVCLSVTDTQSKYTVSISLL